MIGTVIEPLLGLDFTGFIGVASDNRRRRGIVCVRRTVMSVARTIFENQIEILALLQQKGFSGTSRPRDVNVDFERRDQRLKVEIKSLVARHMDGFTIGGQIHFDMPAQ